MNTITTSNSRRATIQFPDFALRVFAKYRSQYCSEIRVWKLPASASFWSMLNTKNLVWAMYGDDAKAIQGFFTPPPVTQPEDKRDWLRVLTDAIARCENYAEVTVLLSNIEKATRGDTAAMTQVAIAADASPDH